MRTTNRRPKQRKYGKPQSHYNTSFDPLVFALDRIKAHFDERAHFCHHPDTHERVIKYAQEDGTRITLGTVQNSRIVYARNFCYFTEDQAKQLVKDLGLVA